MLIAEESTAWPKVTGPPEEDGLGFDYKWNMGWMNDFTGLYAAVIRISASHHHGELTFSMIYAYSENFILVLSHDEVVHRKCSMIGKMPGDLRVTSLPTCSAAYGFMTGPSGQEAAVYGTGVRPDF